MYPNDGITFRAINMILAAHTETVFHNESKALSCVGDHIFLYEDETQPKWNGTVLNLAHIIKLVMSSASETDLGVLFATAK